MPMGTSIRVKFSLIQSLFSLEDEHLDYQPLTSVFLVVVVVMAVSHSKGTRGLIKATHKRISVIQYLRPMTLPVSLIQPSQIGSD
jgi:hypothetical protein